MSDSKLESFKVADRHKPRVKTAQKAGGKAARAEAENNAEASTLGFARIEAILDHENPSQVQKSLAKLIGELDTVGQKADSQKDRAQAKRAKAAVERTIDLLTYLFETKDSMLQAIAQQSKGSDEGKNKRQSARKGNK